MDSIHIHSMNFNSLKEVSFLPVRSIIFYIAFSSVIFKFTLLKYVEVKQVHCTNYKIMRKRRRIEFILVPCVITNLAHTFTYLPKLLKKVAIILLLYVKM